MLTVNRHEAITVENLQMTMLPRAQRLVPMLQFLYLSPPAVTGRQSCCPGMHSPAPGGGRSRCLAVSASQPNNFIKHHA